MMESDLMYIMSLFEELGFQPVKEIKNHYGIKVVVGSEYESDWCVHIPHDVLKVCHTLPRVTTWFDENGFTFYFLSKEEAYKKVEKYTRSMDTYYKKVNK